MKALHGISGDTIPLARGRTYFVFCCPIQALRRSWASWIPTRSTNFFHSYVSGINHDGVFSRRVVSIVGSRSCVVVMVGVVSIVGMVGSSYSCEGVEVAKDSAS